MSNEKLTIQKDKARLTVIGRSYPDENTDSGTGIDLTQELIDILDDLGIDLPDIDPDDWDDIPAIIGLDDDRDPVLVFPDPDTGILIEWPLDDLDWDDFLDNYDLDWMLDMDIVGLDSLTGLDVDISLDTDFSLKVENVPTEIVIVTPPKKLKYIVGQRLDFTGMVVKAVKSDGSTWTSAKYPNGHIPLGELYLDPLVAEFLSLDDFIMRTDRCSSLTTNIHIQATAANGGIIFINRNDELLMKVTFMAEHQGLAGYWGNSPVYANTLVYDNGERQVWKSSQYSYGHNCWLNLNPYYKEDVELDEGEMKKLLGSVQITWCRPSDKKALTAYLEITVMSRAGGGGR